MKKKLTKKLVLKKHTVASLNAEQLEALRGGRVANSDCDCSSPCGPTVSCDGCNGGGTVGVTGGCPIIWKTFTPTCLHC